MPVAVVDQALYNIASAAAPATIQEVIDVLQRMDGCISNTDGLKWFNLLYLEVTSQVDLQPVDKWKDPDWLLELDVVFAGFYFRALSGYLDGDPNTPSSWIAMFEARHRTEVDRIQFALAGMNAHINHDLALALLQMEVQTGSTPALASPQHADYQAVNTLLNSVMPAALQMLAADCLGLLAEDTGEIGRLLAFWDICKARDLAWDFAIHLHDLSGLVRQAALEAQDQVTGTLGRAILSAG